MFENLIMDRRLIFVLVLILSFSWISTDDQNTSEDENEDIASTQMPGEEEEDNHQSVSTTEPNEDQRNSDIEEEIRENTSELFLDGTDDQQNGNEENLSSKSKDDQVHTDIILIKEDKMPDINEMPPLIGKYHNSTYVIYEPRGKNGKTGRNYTHGIPHYEHKRVNSTHEVYQVKSFSLLPGKKADGIWSRMGKVVAVIPVLNRGLGVKCWDDIGCFSAMEVSDGRRVVGLLPMDPLEIDIKYNVFTFQSRNKSFVLSYNFNVNTVLNSTFNSTHQTVLIIHGYKSGISQWMNKIKDMLYSLPSNHYNVILVDWNKGANLLSYGLAASNTQVVGALTAFFINRLCETNFTKKMKNDLFYLIGHSLGAHAMGYAGKRLVKPRVHRITALDPAGPLFDSYPEEARLYYTDAQFVDVIHTDMAENMIAGFGLDAAVGDIDFYPNGGKLQPGCPQSIMVQNALSYPQQVSCSHSRAHQLTAAFGNVKDYCLPIGYMCEDWGTFLEGRCVSCDDIDDISNCQIMGLYPTYFQNFKLDNKRGVGQKYYLNTAKDKGFCRKFIVKQGCAKGP